MVSAHIINYGCTANYDNGTIIAGLLTEKKYLITKDIEPADIVIINSCAVKNVTVSKIFSKLEYISKKYPEKIIIITGCMPLAERGKLSKLNLSLVNTDNITKIPDIIEDIVNKKTINLLEKRKESKLNLTKLQDSKIATVQIASGCTSFCTYCSTKLAKGNIYSFSKEEIIKEIKKYISLGYKRINITSTDNGCYGLDIGTNLSELLNEIIKLDSDFKLRIGMANPEHVKKYYKDLINIFKDKKIIKFLHLPVQSGSDKVLKDMKRDYTIKEFKKIVKEFRKEIPNICISTDIIVGYPTETEEDFKKTI